MSEFILTGFADEAGAELSAQIAALQRNQMHYMEIRNVNGKCVIDLSKEEVTDIRRQLDEGGIKVSSLGSPIGKYNIDAPFEEHLERFRRALEICHILGTDKMRIFSFFIPDGQKARDYRDEVMRRMRILLAEAKEAGVTLCHENEARIYGRMPEEALDLQQELPELKGIFDPSNYIFEDADISWAIDHLAPYLEYLHIKDCELDGHIIVPAGYGDGKITEVIEKTATARGDKPTFLSVEPHLFSFIGYSNLDNRVMKHKFAFANQSESFDAAVNSLKSLLHDAGYMEGENGTWKK